MVRVLARGLKARPTACHKCLHLRNSTADGRHAVSTASEGRCCGCVGTALGDWVPASLCVHMRTSWLGLQADMGCENSRPRS